MKYSESRHLDDMLLVKEAAEEWGVTERRVTGLCKEGKINGAVKEGRSWLIPSNAELPEDSRIKTGAYIKKQKKQWLPLPIGVSEYCSASTEYYYVDKTMLIKEFLDERPKVSLFTRPRRFGKTLNMDMLRVFFEKTEENSSVFFKDKNIWSCGKKYREHQGKYPVIYISFKDIKKATWAETYKCIEQNIIMEYKRHTELAESNKISDSIFYHQVIEGTLEEALFDSSLFMLTKMLHEHHEVAPIVIVDEYDTPIQQGYLCNFYEEVVGFMRNLFSACLKDNYHLSYGFMTGILRVAKESIFSGLNNLKINSVLDNKYSEYFGFTSEEIKEMARYYDAEEKYNEICEWYNGYRFGKTEIFNPWSVINYFSNACEPRAFWQSTGSNDVIGEVLSEATPEIYEKLNQLLQGKSVLTYIDTNVVYPQIKHNPSSIYSFLLMAGYLKAENTKVSFNGDFMCEVALPNKEISYVYNKEILRKLQNILPQSTAVYIQEAIYSGNTQLLREQLGKLLQQSVSYYDTAGENFYHGLVLGLCAMLDNRYYITSNRESGKGRYDIQLLPKQKDMPGILIELKAEKEQADLSKRAKEALKQISERNYDTEMKAHKVQKIFYYGVAFCGKEVAVEME